MLDRADDSIHDRSVKEKRLRPSLGVLDAAWTILHAFDRSLEPGADLAGFPSPRLRMLASGRAPEVANPDPLQGRAKPCM